MGCLFSVVSVFVLIVFLFLFEEAIGIEDSFLIHLLNCDVYFSGVLLPRGKVLILTLLIF